MPPQPGTMRNRWTAYAGLSATLAAGVILKALAQRPNFYSATVYLSQSSANLMILCNLVFVTACTVLLFLQKILYGPLRPIEVEQLYEKAWFAVTETCLAMTIFRGEIGAWFLVMFFSLLAGKVWGWIGEGRVEVLEQQQHNIIGGRNARMFHTRLALSLALSVCFDLTMLEYVAAQVLHMARPDMMVMFGFEFAVLSISSTSTAMRYGLNLIEMGIVMKQKQKRIDAIRKERIDAAVQQVNAQQPTQEGGEIPGEEELVQRRTQAASAAAGQPIDENDIETEGWEAKGRWTFYLDLATDFFKLTTYLTFFFILLIFYGLPLHIMRDVFLTCRSFIKRIGDFMRYRTATRDMNERYPDATEADIGREDVCIICREDMRIYIPPAQGAPVDPLVERMRPKKLPCGHVLHFSCLRSWLERQQICPTCRATVVPTPQARPGAAAAPGAARAQHPQNQGNGRPRIYQFGPLRIGVGAARGNHMFEDLQEQLANLNPPPAQGQNGNGPQQYGFGIRWDGMRRRVQGQHRHARGTVEDQLNAAERQIQRELDSLQASMGEMQALRNVQAQLVRIRMARQAANAQQPQPQPVAQGVAVIPNPPLRQAPTITPLTQNQQGAVLQSGSEQLPEGLALPEGWSMMPLQPLQAPNIPTQPLNPFNVQQHMPQMPHPFLGHNHGPGAPNMDLQALIRQGNEAAQAATAQLNAMNSQHTRPGQVAPEQHTQQQETAQTRQQSAQPQQAPSATTRSNSTTRPESPPAPVAPAPAPASQSPPTARPQQERPQQESRRVSTTRYASPTSQSQSLQPLPGPPSQPQTAASTASRTVPPTTTRATGAVNINTPQHLRPTPTSNGTRSASTSPHRPTRSIGSSWGFSGVEGAKGDDEEDEDSDDDDNDDEGGEQAIRAQRAHANGSTTGHIAHGPSSASNTARTGPDKGKTVMIESDEDSDE